MRLPHHHEMRPDSPALHAEQFHVPHQTCKELDLLDGTPESTQEHCHKSRRTLMSPQEREIAPRTPNQVKMKADSPALAPEPSCIPHHKRKVSWLYLG